VDLLRRLGDTLTTREALCALFLAIAVITTGFVWLYGPYGLIGGGAAIATVTLFADKVDKEEDDG
jgi:hypothetical protein